MMNSPNKFKNKNVSILGLGRSGISSAKRLISLGANVFISEQKEKNAFPSQTLEGIDRLGVKAEFGGHTGRVLEGCDLMILSPGVHLDIPILFQARKKGVPAVSEIEFAYQLIRKPIIAVTGTNGKTTTTTLIAEMLSRAGFRTVAAGNIGFPLSGVDDSTLDFIVCEVSSYQLEGIEGFRPKISLILNITEDHMERHASMDGYAKLKARIFLNQRESDYVVYNADDPIVVELVSSSCAKAVPFSRLKEVGDGVFVKRGEITTSLSGKSEKILDASEVFIKGDHNLENSLAASAASILAGSDIRSIAAVLKDFKGVEHRIEYVQTVNGIAFYNDSKGTNPDSTIVALKALKKNIILIAGGRDKGGDLTKLILEAKDRIKAVVLIGEAKKRFRENFSRENFASIKEAGTMEEAVKTAFGLSRKGDQVLLSPACASFDMFSDFEHRGRAFKEAVSVFAREHKNG